MAIYRDYDEKGEYTVIECDRCNDQAEFLYDDSPEQLCRKCFLEKYKEEFIRDNWEAIVENFADYWLSGVERVNDAD